MTVYQSESIINLNWKCKYSLNEQKKGAEIWKKFRWMFFFTNTIVLQLFSSPHFSLFFFGRHFFFANSPEPTHHSIVSWFYIQSMNADRGKEGIHNPPPRRKWGESLYGDERGQHQCVEYFIITREMYNEDFMSDWKLLAINSSRG